MFIFLEFLGYVDTKSLNSSTSPEYLFKYISLSNVRTGYVDENLDTICFREASSRARRIVQNNDILMATVRPNLKGFAKIKGKKNTTYIASTGFGIITAKNFYNQ